MKVRRANLSSHKTKHPTHNKQREVCSTTPLWALQVAQKDGLAGPGELTACDFLQFLVQWPPMGRLEINYKGWVQLRNKAWHVQGPWFKPLD